VPSGPSIYSSGFPIALVGGKIHFSIPILYESQSKTDGDRNTLTHVKFSLYDFSFKKWQQTTNLFLKTLHE
jgi:hypothetical protein